MMMRSLIAAICTMLFLVGCNTMEGVGKDMEAAGDAIEDSAKDNKNY
jgi:predicted small secreted protein